MAYTVFGLGHCDAVASVVIMGTDIGADDGIVVAVDDTMIIGVVALALLLVMLVIVIPCGLIAVADADNIEPLAIAEFDIALDALVETVVNAFPVTDEIAVVGMGVVGIIIISEILITPPLVPQATYTSPPLA
jgi:hypothetical protein